MKENKRARVPRAKLPRANHAKIRRSTRYAARGNHATIGKLRTLTSRIAAAQLSHPIAHVTVLPLLKALEIMEWKSVFDDLVQKRPGQRIKRAIRKCNWGKRGTL